MSIRYTFRTLHPTSHTLCRTGVKAGIDKVWWSPVFLSFNLCFVLVFGTKSTKDLTCILISSLLTRTVMVRNRCWTFWNCPTHAILSTTFHHTLS